MVESMSEISRRLRRPSDGWTQTSTGRPQTASRAARRRPGNAPAPASTGMSMAPGPSEAAAPGNTPWAARACVARLCAVGSEEGSGVTRVMVNSMRPGG